MEEKSKGTKKITEKKLKTRAVKDFFEKKEVKYTIIGIIIFIISFLIQYFVNKPNFGIFLGSDMDAMGNVYILGVNDDNEQYKVTKINSSGRQEFKVDLDKSTSTSQYSYSNIEADTKGNFYLIKRQKNLEAVVPDKDSYPIKSEQVLMYDTNGNFIKQVMSVDFSKDSNPPTQPYIRKIQLIDQNMTVICGKESTYDVITAYPLKDESPKKSSSFEVKAPAGYTAPSSGWVTDVCVLSSGRIFYSTPNGQFWAMDNNGKFIEYSNAFSSTGFIISGMSVDSYDDIYFTDMISGGFYKLNTKSVTIKEVYNLDSNVLNNANVKLRDLRKVKLIDENDFYAPSKAFDKPYYVRFGIENHLISDIRGNIFPWGILVMLISMAALWGLLYIVKYLSGLDIKRIPLGVHLVTMFVPVLIIAMLALIYINTSDAVNEYVSVLRSEQERGAKTVVDNIEGEDFARIDHVRDYMTKDYSKLKDEVTNSYNEIALKIGDRSDYIVTYIEKYNKLYATISTKYSAESDSYDRLRYTDPDMVTNQCVLVDSIFERDECEKLYSIWEGFSNKNGAASSQEAMFRDVYGDIYASFVAIKDNSGAVVGFAGNFLDEELHRTNEFYKILNHSIAVIVVIAVMIIAYICFVVKWCLYPLKKIEQGIDKVTRGEWKSRIKIISKDEFADIAQAFNLMSEKIERYTSNLIKLNKEYVRYVPSEIFKFMDKEKITQVKLYDQKILEMNIIYVTFNLSCKGSYEFANEVEIFDVLNETYEKMFKIVENNNGVVQSFDGLDCVMLFPGGAQNAFNASVQFKEIDIDPKVKEHMNITLGFGNVLIGVTGNKDRRGVLVVCDEIMQMFNIDTYLRIIGINQVATKGIIDRLDKSLPFSNRYIGRIGNITGEGYTEIYEIIDATNKYKYDLYKSTNKLFEDGIKSYLMGDFEQARKTFTDVVRTNENDKVAIHYLTKCEEYLNKLKNGKENIGFTGYLV